MISGAPDRLVLIFSSGRSGTSALTRMLALAGGTLPEPLLGAGRGNPTGHWEPLEALQLNDELLGERGATWFDPSLALQAEGAWSPDQRESAVTRIAALMAHWPREGVLVVKEPRITALAPLWLEAAQRDGRRTEAIVAVRHPAATAASLVRRDGMSEDYALLLWLKYLLLAERASRGMPRVFVEWSALLADWRGQLARIAAGLDLPFAAPAPEAVDAFLDRGLSSLSDVPCGLPVHPVLPIATVWRELSAAAADRPFDPALLDAIYRWLAATQSLFFGTACEFQTGFAPAPGGLQPTSMPR